MGITMNTTRHNIKFYKYILYHFIFSIIFTLFALMICFKINIISHLFPSYYSCENHIDELYKNDINSVHGTATNLHYSGYDYIINNVVKAHYYYTLNLQTNLKIPKFHLLPLNHSTLQQTSKITTNTSNLC